MIASYARLLSSGFDFQQRPLSLQTPTISAHVATFPDYAMAGNRDGDGVRCACPGNGPCSGWLTDGLCDRRIRARSAERNRLQMRPHAPLKRGGLNVQG